MIEDEVTYIEAGTLLTVEPQINDEKTITVKVRAEVSNIIGWRIGATGMEVPVVRTRKPVPWFASGKGRPLSFPA